MIYNTASFVVLTNVILMQFGRNTDAYRQISNDGNESDDGGGPKIFKAVNFDLIFPKSFNSSENVISATPEIIPSPTKTANNSAVGQPYYPLPQSNQPTYTAATAGEKEQEPTIFVTPAPTQQQQPAVATSNEAGIYDTQQQNTKVVTQNAINMQQQQQQEQHQLNDNNKAEMEQQQNYATGRAVDYHASYPFGQVITPLIKNAPRPVYRKPVTSFATIPSSSSSATSSSSSSPSLSLSAATSNVGKIIYPQGKYQQKPPSQAEIDKLRGKGKFIDRFSPSEGVASHAFKSNHGNSHDHSHDHQNHAPFYKPAGKTPSASNLVSSYVTPSNLYAFPPNNVNYPSQSQDAKASMPSAAVNSYSWPASGSLNDFQPNSNIDGSNGNPYEYNGPISSDYLPPANGGDTSGGMDEGKNNDGGGDGDLDNGMGDESVGVLPASAMDQVSGGSNGDMTGDMVGVDMAGSMDAQDDKTPDDNSYDTEKEYPTPPPGWLKEHPETAQDHRPRKPDIEFEHDHDFHHQPDIIFDHDHGHDHDHYHHSFPSYPIYHNYPDIIYDDHHHDHPHIEHHPPPTTTEAPLPEPPPEPRVKKYSYFYIGRKLWYIPLYFTVWFSFYVLWLILKSIARHKVNLPNHYVARRSLDKYDLSQHQQDIVNQLTVSTLDKIDKFKIKYKN